MDPPDRAAQKRCRPDAADGPALVGASPVGDNVGGSKRAAFDSNFEVPAAAASSLPVPDVPDGGPSCGEPFGGAESAISLVCGPADSHSVMSVLFSAHERDMDEGLLRFFTTREACHLRGLCREFEASVAAAPWHDTATRIRGSLSAWRSSFPSATAANASCRVRPLLDADFVHLRGLRALDLSRNSNARVSDAAFAHLRGIRSLNLDEFAPARTGHVGGFERGGASAESVTACAFANLRGVEELHVSECGALRALCDEALPYLRGVRVLSLAACPAVLCSASLWHLRGVGELDISSCRNLFYGQPAPDPDLQFDFDRDALAPLAGICSLEMSNCGELDGGNASHLGGVEVLHVDDLAGDAVRPLASGLRKLFIANPSYGDPFRGRGHASLESMLNPGVLVNIRYGWGEA